MGYRISEEQKAKAKMLYRNKSMRITEIANLTNISISTMARFLREWFESGELKPRQPQKALTPRTPKGQGKDHYYESNGRPHASQTAWSRRKIQGEQEKQLLYEYYILNWSVKDIKKKYGINEPQLQRIRNHYGEQYKGRKHRGSPSNKQKQALQGK